MIIWVYPPVFILIVILALQIFKRDFLVKHINKIALSSSLIVLAFSVINGFNQYSAWKHNEVSKFLLPPYQKINYFLSYAGWKFVAPFGLSLIFAALFYFAASFTNKKGGERFFEREEIMIASLALFLSGYPGVMIYFFLVLALYLTTHIVSIVISRRSRVIPLYYFWLPSAIFAIIISELWLYKLQLWNLIKI